MACFAFCSSLAIASGAWSARGRVGDSDSGSGSETPEFEFAVKAAPTPALLVLGSDLCLSIDAIAAGAAALTLSLPSEIFIFLDDVLGVGSDLSDSESDKHQLEARTAPTGTVAPGGTMSKAGSPGRFMRSWSTAMMICGRKYVGKAGRRS